MELGEEGYAELHALLEAPWLVYRANHIKKCSFFKKVPPDSPKWLYNVSGYPYFLFEAARVRSLAYSSNDFADSSCHGSSMNHVVFSLPRCFFFGFFKCQSVRVVRWWTDHYEVVFAQQVQLFRPQWPHTKQKADLLSSWYLPSKWLLSQLKHYSNLRDDFQISIINDHSDQNRRGQGIRSPKWPKHSG